jgi:hypothetical protein
MSIDSDEQIQSIRAWSLEVAREQEKVQRRERERKEEEERRERERRQEEERQKEKAELTELLNQLPSKRKREVRLENHFRVYSIIGRELGLQVPPAAIHDSKHLSRMQNMRYGPPAGKCKNPKRPQKAETPGSGEEQQDRRKRKRRGPTLEEESVLELEERGEEEEVADQVSLRAEAIVSCEE